MRCGGFLRDRLNFWNELHRVAAFISELEGNGGKKCAIYRLSACGLYQVMGKDNRPFHVSFLNMPHI
ncbi:hypothetical protein COP1_002612 [Malus domestica]